ncbi:MAG: 50S ribosomal protein L4 [Deltaproteobacteria bacterium]|nr:50S ribosomal protein L4 [Deltaproteobacteria bacterium]MBW2199852.1 50S ribosomal protein L4 [Deltaproteobacteria bacterium]MBW2539241.1 50S ribosomal protein L4 [Deltaproteobacteria bacterium]
MAGMDVLNIKGEKVSQVELVDMIFNVPVKSSVLHEVVKMQLAGKRSGTAAVKHRSDIRGSGRKLFRQKGTGRARRGNIKSPLLRGGGVVFGPDPRSYAYKVPKKVRRLALKMALSSKVQGNNLVVLDQFELDQVKTKKFLEVVNTLKLENVLIVTEKKNENLELSSRNVPDVKVLRSEGLNVYDILKYKKMILLESSIKDIEGRLLA